jgi:hypothetical protein
VDGRDRFCVVNKFLVPFSTQFRQSAPGLVLLLICSTGRADVVAVISAASPPTSLSRNQVADIFLGKIARFPDGTPAVPIDQEAGAPARDEFYSTFTGKSAALLKAYWSKIIFTGRGQPPRALANSVEVKKWLAADPHSIAYLDRSAIDSTVRVVSQP